MRKGIVYGYYQPASGKWYVGKTINENGRKSQHRKSQGRSLNTNFGRAIKKYGYDSFKYEILFSIETDDLDILNKVLSDMEIHFITAKEGYTKGYNLTIGGEGAAGAKRTDEFKKAQSERLKGRKGHQGRVGVKHNEETRIKMSENRKGKTHKLSPEGLIKKQNSCKERLSKTVLQFNRQNECIAEFISLTDASEKTGVGRSCIGSVCNGRQISAGGFIWKFK